MSGAAGDLQHPWNCMADPGGLAYGLPAGGCELEATILFVDVRNSTALAEGLTPTEFSRLLRRFYDVTAQVLARFDGTVDKLLGDGVVALFLPGLGSPDHARRAIDAAHALLAAMDRDAESRPWPPIGIGVHTGRIWLGPVPGPHGRGDLTALGDAVNVAAHLCAAAGAGHVAMSTLALRAAGRPHAAPTVVRLKRRRAPVTARLCAPAPCQPCGCAAEGVIAGARAERSH